MNLTKQQKARLGVGAAAVLAGVLYWRHAAKGAKSASSADPNAINPLTGMPYAQDQSTDPLTGLTYLSEAQQYGSVQAAEAAFSGAGGSGYGAGYGAASGGTAGFPTSNVGGTTAGNGYATNAQWSQAVTAGLVQLGYDPQAIGAALGAFFAQMQLTADQAAIVQAAEAEFGPPPQGTYAIVTAPSSGGPGGSGAGNPGPGPGGSGGGPGPGAGPGVIKVAPTGFRVVSVTSHDTVNLAWNPVKGATGYEIAYGPTPGSQKYRQGVGGGNTTQASVPGVGAGSAGKHYFELWALPAAPGGPHAGPIEATTTKA